MLGLLSTELWCDSTEIVCGIETVLAILYFIWLYNWANKQLANTAIAVLFAVIVIYLTVWIHPWLVWIPALIFLFNAGYLKSVIFTFIGNVGGGHGGDHGGGHH